MVSINDDEPPLKNGEEQTPPKKPKANQNLPDKPQDSASEEFSEQDKDGEAKKIKNTSFTQTIRYFAAQKILLVVTDFLKRLALFIVYLSFAGSILPLIYELGTLYWAAKDTQSIPVILDLLPFQIFLLLGVSTASLAIVTIGFLRNLKSTTNLSYKYLKILMQIIMQIIFDE